MTIFLEQMNGRATTKRQVTSCFLSGVQYSIDNCSLAQ